MEMDDDDELKDEMINEITSSLDDLDNFLIDLEKNPDNADGVNEIFRLLHSIKGLSSFFNYTGIEKVAHNGEHLLDLIRTGEISVSTEIISALLTTIDVLREFMTNIEEIDCEGDVVHEPIIEQLSALIKKEMTPGQSDETSPVVTKEEEIDDQEHSELDALMDADPIAMSSDPLPSSDKTKIEQPMPEELDQDATQTLRSEQEAMPETKQQDQSKTALSTESRKPTDSNEPQKKKSADNYIQIDVNLLDSLVNLVGELVLSRNQILTYSTNSEDHDFQHVCQVLNYVATQIQENVMKMRLQPVGLVWNKFNRIVRDLAITCEKKITLEMEGSETTLDKSLIDSIKDPLTHLIRNAVDHGIELPHERLNKGKNETGHIKLKSYQENGQIVIEIADDGKGLQTDKIKEKALNKGLVTATELDVMTKENLLNLVFKPGFSTNDEVTNISGRGVGMDVVKSNIESIGGSVEISSDIDIGSTFKIQIPLTLAIIPTLIFQNKGFSFAIPQNNIIELVRARKSVVEHIHNVMVYRLRGTLLPIISLTELLNMKEDENTNKALNDEDLILPIIVVEANDCRFGIIVDKIQSTQDIVVKPLSNKIKELLIYSGVTILGNGDVALILDLNELARKAKLSSEQHLTLNASHESHKKNVESQLSLVLLVKNNKASQIAVPIDLVKRLEKITIKNIESVAGKNVVQYHDKILTLIKLSELIDNDGRDLSEYTDNLDIFVYSHNDCQDIGIIVDKIIDSSNENISNPQGSMRAGVKGTAIIRDKITEILDKETFHEKIISYVS